MALFETIMTLLGVAVVSIGIVQLFNALDHPHHHTF